MTNKELADKLVEMGIAEHDASLPGALTYSVRNRHGHWDHFSADLLVTDWRVAGAVMERISHLQIDIDQTNPECRWCVYCHNVGNEGDVANSDDLPRAIIEAGLEALDS